MKTKNNYFALVAIALLLPFSHMACSRKSGCPAEDVHVKTDKDGIPKAGKTKSGLLPAKAARKRKS